jgi:hypothetical protein
MSASGLFPPASGVMAPATTLAPSEIKKEKKIQAARAASYISIIKIPVIFEG